MKAKKLVEKLKSIKNTIDLNKINDPGYFSIEIISYDWYEYEIYNGEFEGYPVEIKLCNFDDGNLYASWLNYEENFIELMLETISNEKLKTINNQNAIDYLGFEIECEAFAMEIEKIKWKDNNTPENIKKKFIETINNDEETDAVGWIWDNLNYEDSGLVLNGINGMVLRYNNEEFMYDEVMKTNTN